MKLSIVALLLFSSLHPPEDFGAAFQTRQLVVVTSRDWNASIGKLSFYEQQEDGSWTFLLKDVPVVLGKKGMAWGHGLQPAELNTSPLKKEGDGKSPAGIFRITHVFGYGDRAFKMKYLKADSTVFCVDDIASVNYNQIVNTQAIDKDWNSAEEMKRKDHLYRWGAVVAYNTQPVIKGNGSCIFLHIWRSPASGTAGCTAMTEVNLVTLLESLDPAKNPTLLQMPERELSSLRNRYRFP
jgi:L,D-peptidoglycan transpeptidase YkuD (ErfK/YbiS/YcfS/YnhG family)